MARLTPAPGTRLAAKTKKTTNGARVDGPVVNGRWKRGAAVRFRTSGRAGLSDWGRGIVVRTHTTAVGDYVEIKPDGAMAGFTIKTRPKHIQAV